MSPELRPSQAPAPVRGPRVSTARAFDPWLSAEVTKLRTLRTLRLPQTRIPGTLLEP